MGNFGVYGNWAVKSRNIADYAAVLQNDRNLKVTKEDMKGSVRYDYTDANGNYVGCVFKVDGKIQDVSYYTQKDSFGFYKEYHIHDITKDGKVNAIQEVDNQTGFTANTCNLNSMARQLSNNSNYKIGQVKNLGKDDKQYIYVDNNGKTVGSILVKNKKIFDVDIISSYGAGGSFSASDFDGDGRADIVSNVKNIYLNYDK